MIRELTVATSGAGLIEVTARVRDLVTEAAVREGLCTLFVQHTSASLLVQENADPDVRRDLEAFFQRLVPEGDPIFVHTDEGPDDMPAHVRSALTLTSLSIPIARGELALGRWQGIYLWEHRRTGRSRRIMVHIA